jgi:hypothetical protein
LLHKEGRYFYHNPALKPTKAARVDLRGALCEGDRMAIARISELERKTTQSGKANAGLWLLEFERQQPLRPDPLTGWNGSGDTNPQVRLTFPTKEAAIAYCEKHGLQHHVVPAPPVRMKIQAYADNFR